MITENDFNIIKQAILKTVPDNEKELATVLINVGLDVYFKLERITVAFETIAKNKNA